MSFQIQVSLQAFVQKNCQNVTQLNLKQLKSNFVEVRHSSHLEPTHIISGVSPYNLWNLHPKLFSHF